MSHFWHEKVPSLILDLDSPPHLQRTQSFSRPQMSAKKISLEELFSFFFSLYSFIRHLWASFRSPLLGALLYIYHKVLLGILEFLNTDPFKKLGLKIIVILLLWRVKKWTKKNNNNNVVWMLRNENTLTYFWLCTVHLRLLIFDTFSTWKKHESELTKGNLIIEKIEEIQLQNKKVYKFS